MGDFRQPRRQRDIQKSEHAADKPYGRVAPIARQCVMPALLRQQQPARAKHFPTDVLAGGLIGLAAEALVDAAVRAVSASAR